MSKTASQAGIVCDAFPAVFTCKVVSKTALSPRIFEVAFEIASKEWQHKPGQYLIVSFPWGIGGKEIKRSFSLASPPEQKTLEFCIQKQNDPFSGYFEALRPGDNFPATGPHGDFIFKPRAGRHVCFIATHSGIAPLRSMMLSETFQIAKTRSATCIFGVRHTTDIIYKTSLEQIDRLKTVIAVSRPDDLWSGFRGRVTDYLRNLGDHFPWANTDFYICGNFAMMTDVIGLLFERNVSESAIFTEAHFKLSKGTGRI